MTNIAQFLLVIVITTLTFLAAIIAIQIVHLLHDLRKAVQKFSRLLDHSSSISDLISKPLDTNEPSVKKHLFHHSSTPIKSS